MLGSRYVKAALKEYNKLEPNSQSTKIKNTRRNTSDLKDLISQCKSTTADESIFIQKTYTRIEKTELDVLNGRIEEQKNLIEFYKSRGDTHKKQFHKLERSNKELVEEKENLFKNFDLINDKNKALTEQIEDLVETKISLQRTIDAKSHQIQVISEEKVELQNSFQKLWEDFKNSKLHYENEISELTGACKDIDLKLKTIFCERDRMLTDQKEVHEIEVKTLNKKIFEIETKNERSSEAFTAEIENLNIQINDLNTQLLLKSNKIAKILAGMDKQEIKLQKLDEEFKHEKSQIRELMKELDNKMSENTVLKDELAEKAKEVNSLVYERNEISVEIENLNSAITHKQTENSSMKNKINELGKTIKDLHDKLREKESETEAKIKKLNATIQKISADKDEIKQECQKLNQEKNIFLKKCIGFQEMIQELYGQTIKLKENPVNKNLEFDLSESIKRYEELFEEFIYYKSYVRTQRAKIGGFTNTKTGRLSPSKSSTTNT